VESLIFFVLILIGNSLLPIVLPWWILIPFNFLATLPFRLSKGWGFWLAAFGTGSVWLTLTLWISHHNDHLLARRLTDLMALPYPVLLFAVVFFIPFLVGGIASLAGISFKQFLLHGKQPGF
jgi:hypothetical protein